MIPMKIVISHKGIRKRDVPRINKIVNFRLAEFRFEKQLQQHFRNEAAGRYGYDPRSSRYVRAKLKKFGHSRPLEFSSRLRLKMKIFKDIRATSKSGRAVLHGQKYLHLFSKKLNQPNMAKELRATDKRDIKRQTAFHQKVLQREVDKIEKAASSRKITNASSVS